MKLAKTIEELPDVFIPVPDLKRLVATLRKCETELREIKADVNCVHAWQKCDELLTELREVLYGN